MNENCGITSWQYCFVVESSSSNFLPFHSECWNLRKCVSILTRAVTLFKYTRQVVRREIWTIISTNSCKHAKHFSRCWKTQLRFCSCEENNSLCTNNCLWRWGVGVRSNIYTSVLMILSAPLRHSRLAHLHPVQGIINNPSK